MARRIEPARRSVALAASALLVWAALSPAAAAQNPGDYEHLIDLYAAGDIQNAVAVLGGWTTRSVTAAARGPLLLPDRQRAAVMLHTDVAAALTNIDNVRAFFHLEFARALVGRIPFRRDQDSQALEFVRHWYEFAPTVYLLANDVYRARGCMSEGLTRLPAPHSMLHFYQGVTFEIEGTRPGTPLTPRGFNRHGGRSGALEAAADAYRRSLTEDEHLAAARLHLGWVHFGQHDARARQELEAALADAGPDIATRYLAHLFLGALAERDQRLADALHEFEEACAVGPQYQTAYIALARVAEELGDVDHAREAAAAMIDLQKGEDPWWNYLGGFNMDALAWLRAAARAR